jgi:hypothetical protein
MGNNQTSSEKFVYKNLLERKKLTLEELSAYYRDLRKYESDNNFKVKGIELRKKINFLLVDLIKINRLIQHYTITMIGDEHYETNRPKIYALTHVGRYDAEVGIEVTKDSSFVFMGDPGAVYRSPDIIALNLKGRVFCDTDHREDCHIAELTGNKILKQGGNITIYPEGAWNITPNKIVQELYNGTVRMAKTCGAEIIPVAIENFDGNYSVKIGKNFYIPSTCTYSYNALSTQLRDILATLKWDIYQSKPITLRSELKMTEQDYVDSIMKDTENGYTVSEIKRTRYQDPKEAEPEEVFAYEKKLIPNSNNAFLYRDMHNFNSIK